MEAEEKLFLRILKRRKDKSKKLFYSDFEKYWTSRMRPLKGVINSLKDARLIKEFKHKTAFTM